MVQINVDDEAVQKVIQDDTQAAYDKIAKFIGDKGTISRHFTDYLKIEIVSLVSKYVFYQQ